MKELAISFLRLGFIAFGGPAAHISLFEEEFVHRKKWFTHGEFLDMLGATHLIPGPNSTELVFHIGLKREGFKGMLVAGLCFISPAALIVGIIAHIYSLYGTLPDAQNMMKGIYPVLIAIIIQAILRLHKTALKTLPLKSLAILSGVLSFLGVSEIALLLSLSGLFYLAHESSKLLGRKFNSTLLGPGLLGAFSSTPHLTYSDTSLAVFFLKMGSLLFGSGYALIAFIRGDLVERWRWLSDAQLLDAITVGQFTPGPLLTTSTFIGYILSGPKGALIATVAIFLPGFILVYVSAPLISKLRKSQRAGRILDAVNAISWSLMTVAGIQLFQGLHLDFLSLGILIASTLLLIRFRVSSMILILAGAAMGIMIN